MNRRMTLLRFVLVIMASAASASLPLRAAAPVGMEELYRLDRLPAFRTSVKVGSVSSYDRSGGNDDGFSGKYSFVRKDPEGLVLADLQGPGVIYRLWTPTPTDDVIEFLFDGESKPRLASRFRDLFLGKDPAFPRPLVGSGAGGYYSYVPLPFAKSCVVRVRAAKVQFYQINYALFAPDAGLASFDPDFTEAYLKQRQQACELWSGAGGRDITKFTAPPGDTVHTTRIAALLSPNSTTTVFDATEGGRIVGLRLSPASAIAGHARDLTLKITFDAEEAVLCPLGDFFGYAWGAPAMRSLLAGTAGETNYCYLPMPFDRSARIEILSERAAPVELHAEVSHTATARAADEGRLHAIWRRENPTTLGEPYMFVQTTGHGHLVGVALQAQGFESGKTLFFEGDDETLLDGEDRIHGTGSEDFFNGGWYDVPDRWDKQISFPLSGSLGYAKHLGRTGGYRFFIGDAYAYAHSLRQTIEHSGEKNNIATDYCSVSYLYSDQPLNPRPALPDLTHRAVHDLREVIFPAWWQLPIHAWSFEHASLTRQKEKVDGEEVRFLSLTATNQDWFGPHFLAPVCEVPADGVYAISMEALRGPGQGMVQLFQDENPVADPVDLYASKRAKSGRLFLGRIHLAEGKNNLMFKLVGKNAEAAGLGLDLISLICAREP
jgi:hypothetical protein